MRVAAGFNAMAKAGRRIVLLLACLAGLLLDAEAASERRIALVIGNGHYDSLARLDTPGRDAVLIAEELRRTGFTQVTLLTDLTRERLVEALREFAGLARETDWAMVYYAGHGIEVNGESHLIPVNARLTAERDLSREAVPLDQALASVGAARAMGLLVYDASRDNPFANAKKRGEATRLPERGLAGIEPKGGMLIAFAAKPGQRVEDGSGPHGPFATALAKHMRMPGLEIKGMFRHIRDDVLAATNRRQEPFVYGSLPIEAFYFTPPLNP